jgi:hypothetical protein
MTNRNQEREGGCRCLERAESNFDHGRVMNRSTVRGLASIRSGKRCLSGRLRTGWRCGRSLATSLAPAVPLLSFQVNITGQPLAPQNDARDRTSGNTLIKLIQRKMKVPPLARDRRPGLWLKAVLGEANALIFR